MPDLVVVETSRNGAVFLSLLLEQHVKGRLSWPVEGTLSGPSLLTAFKSVMDAVSALVDVPDKPWRVVWLASPRALLSVLRLLDEAYWGLRLSATDRQILVNLKNELRESL